MKFTTQSLLFFIIIVSLLQCSNSDNQANRYVVILSLDGFRWDYIDKFPTPNLDYIAKHGVKAKSMIPGFPSVTFANHYTLATGLYPDHHGIVLNQFHATDLGSVYNDPKDRKSVTDGRFYGGEPIWVTAEKQQIKTASYFWVGSEAEIAGKRPSIWKKYDQKLPFNQRIDSVVTWLQLPENQRPGLIMLYFHEPDESGHHLGPENDSLSTTIVYLDSLVGDLRKKLSDLPIGKNIDLIIVSDHGMVQLSKDRQILLDQCIDTSMIEFADGWNPTMNIKVKPGFNDSLMNQLSKVEHLKAWKHGQGPAYLNHGSNIRTHDITILADDGWSILWSWSKGKVKGTHGYDIKNKDVHAIFYAIGPDFKQGYLKPSFQNIHVYPLLAHLLHLKPVKTDGNLDSIIDITLNN
ncbi:MAG: alkaline phosphatase family protein [Bacteroidales bacterium]|nr:alkaline phosphatase family protein [Bacteroidales bacterium]